MICSRYLGAGRLAMVDKYHNSSYQKIMIIIIFPTRLVAWSPLSVHQAINASIVPFYNADKVDTGDTVVDRDSKRLLYVDRCVRDRSGQRWC